MKTTVANLRPFFPQPKFGDCVGEQIHAYFDNMADDATFPQIRDAQMEDTIMAQVRAKCPKNQPTHNKLCRRIDAFINTVWVSVRATRTQKQAA